MLSLLWIRSPTVWGQVGLFKAISQEAQCSLKVVPNAMACMGPSFRQPPCHMNFGPTWQGGVGVCHHLFKLLKGS